MSLRVLHCPLNNANHAWVLSRAERKLGLESDLVIFKKHPLFDRYDRYLKIDSPTIPNEIKRLSFLHQALKNYDIFHFNFGQSIWDHPFPGFNYLDLPLIKRHRKKIIFTFQGDDIRQKDFFLSHFGQGHYPSKNYSLIDRLFDYNKRLRSKKVAKFADVIFALNPDLLWVLPKRAQFLPYANIYERTFRKSKSKDGILTIVHAPTDRQVKGSEEIIFTVKKLSQKYPIKLLLIENVSHDQAEKLYQEADIAIDQLKVGWYGRFAVEMMSLGVPTISYLRDSDVKKFVPFWQEIPIVNISEQSLELALIMLIENPRLRKKIGQKSRQFVEKYHDPLKIAQKTKKIYEDLCAES